MNLALDSRIGWEGIRPIAVARCVELGGDALWRPCLSARAQRPSILPRELPVMLTTHFHRDSQSATSCSAIPATLTKSC